MVEDNIKAVIKPQYVDHIPRTVQGNVREILAKRDERKIMDQMCEELGKGSNLFLFSAALHIIATLVFVVPILVAIFCLMSGRVDSCAGS